MIKVMYMRSYENPIVITFTGILYAQTGGISKDLSIKEAHELRRALDAVIKKAVDKRA